MEATKNYDKANALIEDTYMKFFNEKRLLYLETDASGVGLGTRLLQIRDEMYCL